MFWPVNNAIVDLSIKMKGNSLSPLGVQNRDVGTASQTLLPEVKYVYDAG